MQAESLSGKKERLGGKLFVLCVKSNGVSSCAQHPLYNSSPCGGTVTETGGLETDFKGVVFHSTVPLFSREGEVELKCLCNWASTVLPTIHQIALCTCT